MNYILISLCSLILFLYPYFIYPAILRLLPKKPLKKNNFFECDLKYGLVFCAYNEENSLPKKIENLRSVKSNFPKLKIMAYSDCSSDKTNQILSDASDVIETIFGNERLGKATGMKKLVENINVDIIVFTDANVLLETNAIGALKKYFSNPEIGTVSGKLVYTNEKDGITAEVGNSYWKHEENIKMLETNTGSTMGSDGSIFAMRKNLYPHVPPDLLDDLTASIEPLFRGQRVISAPDVIAFELLTTKSNDEFNRKRRIACRAFNTAKFLHPKLSHMSLVNRFKFFSHKTIRWFGPFFLCLSFFSGLYSIYTLHGIGTSLVLLCSFIAILWIGRIFKINKINRVNEVFLALAATGIGIVESCFGKKYQTWQPAQSRSECERND